jgi:hypothetical protein
MTSADHLGSQLPARASPGLLAIWLLWAAILIISAISAGDALMADPDDFMRLAQVRDWMAGQSWFDVSQYRINPPEGGSMHWSRLLDVPIAASIGFAGLFLPPLMAEHVAIIVLPILLLGVLMLTVYRTARSLADERVALLAAFLTPTFPLIVRQFMPGRIDHHSWQIVMAAIAMLAIFDRKPKHSALVMAFALSLWMHISIEGLPYAVIFGAILALTYVFPMATTGQPSDTRLIPFVIGLSIFSTGLFAATQSFANMLAPHCDAVSWPLLATLAVVATGIGIGITMFKPSRPGVKLLLLGSVGAAASVMYIMLSDSCALDPFGNLTPLVREYWHETISEGLPITGQAPAIVSLLLFVPAIFALWIVIMLRSETDAARRRQWLLLAMLVTASTLLSFKVQRTAGVAELFALPGIAALTAMTLRRFTQAPQMLVRVVGAVVVVLLLSPMTAFVAGDALFGRAAQSTKATATVPKKRPCDIAELSKLPPGRIFTTMAAGPAILYHTQHSVFVSGYHRNYKAMDRLIATMLGPVDDARRILIDAQIDYVVFCPAHFEAQSYIRGARSGFAASLLSAEQPIWLRPVSSFSPSEMRVYRFDAKLASQDDAL